MQDITRTARLWIGAGAALLAAALIFHGPPDPDLTKQLQHIADHGNQWAIVHSTAAVALLLLSGGAFLMLLGRAAGETAFGHPGAWMVMALGALTTVTTAVAEASVVSVAAHAGDQAAFDTWWAFSSGMANGFFALAIAVGAIALAATRSGRSRPPQWASGIGTAAGFLSALGWSLGEQMGFTIGGPIWVISTLVMCVWLVWFGFAGTTAVRETRPAHA